MYTNAHHNSIVEGLKEQIKLLQGAHNEALSAIRLETSRLESAYKQQIVELQSQVFRLEGLVLNNLKTKQGQAQDELAQTDSNESGYSGIQARLIQRDKKRRLALVSDDKETINAIVAKELRGNGA